MKKKINSYKKSGVNIDLANKFVKHISKLSKKNVKKKRNNLYDANIGAFGSSYDISKLKIKDPILVSSTDGVGTKIELSIKYKKLNKIGIDLVAMCVNDLIVQGAKPLFFLDYIAVGKLRLKNTKKILSGIINGCNQSDCELIGGETAEMPGVYANNKFDLAGFTVGIVSKKKILGKEKVRVGNKILAIPSTGPHSNGYSLIRKIIKNRRLSRKIINQLIMPTKIYVKEIMKLQNKNLINSAAHITGGGLIENLVRSVPTNLSIKIDLAKIKALKIFKWLKRNNISESEMIRTFNCGIGFCIIVEKKNIKKISRFFSNNFKPYIIGEIENKKNKLNLVNKIKW